MSPVQPRAVKRALAVIGVAFLLFGCAVPVASPVDGPLIGYDGPDIGADYYEPYGFVGGWAPGYRIGPFHDERRYVGHFGADRGWRGSAAGHIPSIARAPRAGGFRGGALRGGGNRGGFGRGR